MKVYLTAEEAYDIVIGGYERIKVWLARPGRTEYINSPYDRPHHIWHRSGHRSNDGYSLCKNPGFGETHAILWSAACENFNMDLNRDRIALVDADVRAQWESLTKVPFDRWCPEVRLPDPTSVHVGWKDHRMTALSVYLGRPGTEIEPRYLDDELIAPWQRCEFPKVLSADAGDSLIAIEDPHIRNLIKAAIAAPPQGHEILTLIDPSLEPLSAFSP